MNNDNYINPAEISKSMDDEGSMSDQEVKNGAPVAGMVSKIEKAGVGEMGQSTYIADGAAMAIKNEFGEFELIVRPIRYAKYTN